MRRRIGIDGEVAGVQTGTSSSLVGGGGKYQRILNAAFEVSAENGCFGSAVSATAARAGVADGTIYGYFKSKDDVLRTAVDAVFTAKFKKSSGC